MGDSTRTSKAKTRIEDKVSRNGFESLLFFRCRFVVRNHVGRFHDARYQTRERDEKDVYGTRVQSRVAECALDLVCHQSFMATLPVHFSSSKLFRRCYSTCRVPDTVSSRLRTPQRSIPSSSKPLRISTQGSALFTQHYGISSSFRTCRYVSSPLSDVTTRNRRYLATSTFEDDSDAPWGDRAKNTRAKYDHRQKKSKSAKGRAFKDVVGYGEMLHGVEAGLSPARAMRKARKLQPKPFSGKVAMYFANTSTEPERIITEETLESMPAPNTVRTVKSIRVTSGMLGTSSTDGLVDYITDMQKTASAEAIQHHMSKLIKTAEREEAPIAALKPQVKSVDRPETMLVEEEPVVEDLDEEYDEEMYEEMDDDDDEQVEKKEKSGEKPYRPIRIRPEEDLEYMSPATQEAVKKVRKMFQGSLTWCQPLAGEITEYFEAQRQRKATIPSQRAALTSATAMSVRSILSQTANAQSAAELGEKKAKNKSLAKIQPKAFFDASKISELATSDYAKSKRAGSEMQGLLKDVINLPQICVVGRSNVGKSSLLNAIMGPKFDKLRVSKTPGRTQMVQMLTVSEKLVVVDMPGYGFAAASPAARKAMEQRIGEYLTSRLPRRVFMLIDARRGIGKSDVRLADSLEQLKIVYQVVLTKIDKVTNIEQAALVEKNVADWISRRSCAMPQIIKTSSKLGSGLDQLRLAIYLACGFQL